MNKINLCAIFCILLCFLSGCGQSVSELGKNAEKKLDSVESAETLVQNKTGWNNNKKCFYSWQVCDKNDNEITLLFNALGKCASFLEVNVNNEHRKTTHTSKLCGLSFSTTLDKDETLTFTVTDGKTQLFTCITKDEKNHIKSTVSVKKLITLLEKRGLKLKVMLYAEDKEAKAAFIALIPKKLLNKRK